MRLISDAAALYKSFCGLYRSDSDKISLLKTCFSKAGCSFIIDILFCAVLVFTGTSLRPLVGVLFAI